MSLSDILRDISSDSSGSSRERQLSRLAEWSRDNCSAGADEIESISRSVSLLANTEGLRLIADRLAGDSSGTARFLAAFAYDAMRDFPSACAVLDSFSSSHSRAVEVLRLLALARTRIASGSVDSAAAPLRRAISLSDSHRALSAAAKLLRQLERSGVSTRGRVCRVAILGNATFEFFMPVLKTVAFASGIDLVPYIGPYGQVEQEILSESSALRRFSPEALILATNRYSLGWDEIVPDGKQALERKVAEIESLWDAAAQRFNCHIFQHNFVAPEISALGGLGESLPDARGNMIRRLNILLFESARKRSNVSILPVDQIASLVGIRRWDDSRMWIAAKQYPSADSAAVLAKSQAAQFQALLGMSAKCLVLDLDNVLWGGIIGEDGLEGIRLGGSPEGEAFTEFQRYIKALRNRGVILAVCSKNNPDDARQPFLSHPEMVLALEDISLFAANWSPKVDNLRTIAAELNIGLDALVFIDDSPFEREHVRRHLPEIRVPEMPEDPALFTETLHREHYFEVLSITAEDLGRSDSYRANRERQQMLQSAEPIEDYLAGLQIRVELHPFDRPNLPRIAQLLNKTNQFNLTTVRMTPEQIQVFADNPSNYTQFMRYQDRFGNSGITGLMMASPDGDALEIELWLISCRVLGRRVEDAMMAGIWGFARAQGYSALAASYIPTPKNSQVADLYDRLGFELVAQLPSGERHYRASLFAERSAPGFMTLADSTGTAYVAT